MSSLRRADGDAVHFGARVGACGDAAIDPSVTAIADEEAVDRAMPLSDFLPSLRGHLQSLCLAIELAHAHSGAGPSPGVQEVLERVQGFIGIERWHALRDALLSFYDDHVQGGSVAAHPAGRRDAGAVRRACDAMLAEILVLRAYQCLFEFVDSVIDEFDGNA